MIGVVEEIPLIHVIIATLTRTTSVNCSAAASVNNDSQDSTNNLTRSATELSTTTSSVKNSYRAPLVVTVNSFGGNS